MASSQNGFVLLGLPIAVNLSKCEKILYSLCKSKKAPRSSFYKDEWFLDSGASTYFTPFESDFVNMTLDIRLMKFGSKFLLIFFSFYFSSFLFFSFLGTGVRG